MTLNFNTAGSNSIPFELDRDYVSTSFVSDRAPAGAQWRLGYISSNPVNPAGGLSDDSIDPTELLIADAGTFGEILRKGTHYFHPGYAGIACLVQLNLIEAPAQN